MININSINGIEKQYFTKEEIISGGFDLLSAYISALDYTEIKTTMKVLVL